MHFRGGCCIARYAGCGSEYDVSKVDRIMLRFRPIAPKPPTGGSGSLPSSAGEICTKSCRGKRKYTKENNKSNSRSSGSVSGNSNGNSNKRCNKKRREEKNGRDAIAAAGKGDAEVVTLPLLPEAPERREYTSARVFDSPVEGKQTPARFLLNFCGVDAAARGVEQTVVNSLDLTEVMTASTETVLSCVTVEGITDTWAGSEYGLGSTDEEIRLNLEMDTCPGFVSDCLGRVTWTNGKYRELVGQGGSQNGAMMVWLVMSEMQMRTCRGFTCRVRLQYTCGNKEKSSITLPCDVWKMTHGGFAWRLDTSAALSLALGR